MANIDFIDDNPFQKVYLAVPKQEIFFYGPKGLKFHCSHSTMINAFKYTGLSQEMLESLSRYNGYDVVFDDDLPEGEVFAITRSGQKILA